MESYRKLKKQMVNDNESSTSKQNNRQHTLPKIDHHISRVRNTHLHIKKNLGLITDNSDRPLSSRSIKKINPTLETKRREIIESKSPRKKKEIANKLVQKKLEIEENKEHKENNEIVVRFKEDTKGTISVKDNEHKEHKALKEKKRT